MKEPTNILRIFRETKKAIQENDSLALKKLSNQTIHTATLAQDPDNIIVAVLVYSLGKIIEREHYKTMPGWKEFYKILMKNLNKAIISLEQDNIEKFREHIGEIRYSLDEISENLSEYIKDVFRKAEINKAFKIYEHGLSAGKTAKLLGISIWDLASYIGNSSISEAKVSQTLPVKQRIKYAEEIFR